MQLYCVIANLLHLISHLWLHLLTVLLSHLSVTHEKVSKLLSQSYNDTNCDLDPIPTSLMKRCSSVLLHSCYTNHQSYTFTVTFSDHPHLKKSNLGKDNPANYRPIFRLTCLSMLMQELSSVASLSICLTIIS
jgi:hypothetical protein